MPESWHTQCLLSHHAGKCAIDIIAEAYEELEHMQMVGPAGYYKGLPSGLEDSGWICELILRWATTAEKNGEQQPMQ